MRIKEIFLLFIKNIEDYILNISYIKKLMQSKYVQKLYKYKIVQKYGWLIKYIIILKILKWLIFIILLIYFMYSSIY